MNCIRPSAFILLDDNKAAKTESESSHLACEANVGVGNSPDGFDGRQDLIEWAVPLPHEVSNGQSCAPRHTLGAVQQDVPTT